MPGSLNKKIIELENKFSILITKYKKLEAANENLKEITDKELTLSYISSITLIIQT